DPLVADDVAAEGRQDDTGDALRLRPRRVLARLAYGLDEFQPAFVVPAARRTGGTVGVRGRDHPVPVRERGLVRGHRRHAASDSSPAEGLRRRYRRPAGAGPRPAAAVPRDALGPRSAADLLASAAADLDAARLGLFGHRDAQGQDA